ncbi:MAG: hypothetical protein SXQ77_07785, partial [Halobacteria archaeon]|nr:hypothetical protein [Halobacteria archaeon]
GIAVLSAVLGSPWKMLSPWRTVYAALVRVEGSELNEVGEYPSRLGYLPAFLGFVVFVGVTENLTTVPLSPRSTSLALLGYTL